MAIQTMQTDGGQIKPPATSAPYHDPNWSAAQPNIQQAAPATAQTQTVYPTLNIGARGEDVSTLQRQLQAAGYNPGVIDGIYGEKTAAAVRAYQQAHNLTVDGIAGQQTFSSLAERYTGNIAPWSVTNQQTQQAVSQQITPVPTAPTPTTTPSTTTKQATTGGVSTTIKQPTAPTVQPIDFAPLQTSDLKAPDVTIQVPKFTENPYLQELTQMRFEYNPFEDPEYLQTASHIENQVAQAMVGRGGLYSSVAQSALSSKMISLQNDFRAQRHNEFIQNRTFTMQMAQFTYQMQQQEFENQFNIIRHQFDVQKEDFRQQLSIAEYNLAVQKEMFDQQFRQAQFQFQQEQAAYERQYRERQLALQAEQMRLANEMAMFEQQQAHALSQFQIASTELVAERDLMNSLLAKWETQNYATPDIARYFGVTLNEAFNTSDAGIARYDKRRAIESGAQMLTNFAYDYNLGQYSMDFIKNITRIEVSDATPEYIKITERTDALGDQTITREWREPATGTTAPTLTVSPKPAVQYSNLGLTSVAR